MSRRTDIDVEDLERLFAALHYAIERTKELEPSVSQYLETEFAEVKAHIENEHTGTDIAVEIDAVLKFLGGDS